MLCSDSATENVEVCESGLQPGSFHLLSDLLQKAQSLPRKVMSMRRCISWPRMAWSRTCRDPGRLSAACGVSRCGIIGFGTKLMQRHQHLSRTGAGAAWRSRREPRIKRAWSPCRSKGTEMPQLRLLRNHLWCRCAGFEQMPGLADLCFKTLKGLHVIVGCRRASELSLPAATGACQRCGRGEDSSLLHGEAGPTNNLRVFRSAVHDDSIQSLHIQGASCQGFRVVGRIDLHTSKPALCTRSGVLHEHRSCLVGRPLPEDILQGHRALSSKHG